MASNLKMNGDKAAQSMFSLCCFYSRATHNRGNACDVSVGGSNSSNGEKMHKQV